ncbi:histone-lysine N-methyltransferase ASHR1 isoform X1 [Telopea speciosissima]|uniref:histone-lysine N-methyltransferase ASHR1 isoform X1 n=1 Tax=Telopea speciosissima TaxID=54955 RepID=UPI001CC7D6CC|nr:histone-lysine N-methyltransferase ASHR1 isoform X1 [Telopea speciosissima]
MEDLQSALSGRGLTVSTHPEKGRCLVSIRDFSPGDVIISQEPYASVPNNSSVDVKCDGCFTSSNLKKCSACQAVWYCGSMCQKLEWKLHRLECQALAGLSKNRRKSVTPSIRLMMRLYLKRKLQSEQVIPKTATDNYNLVEALVSRILIHYLLVNNVLAPYTFWPFFVFFFNSLSWLFDLTIDFLQDMPDIDENQLVLYAQMANLVNLILQWPDINIKEIAENFSKLACNAHTICDSELRPLGTGLYPVVSIINHSCLPNSVLVFEGNEAVVRAMEPIPKGTEVLISYIETAGSTATRLKALKEQYLFTCTCSRCMKVGLDDDIQESAILEGYRCKDDKCNGFLLRDADDNSFRCQQCGLLRKKEEIDQITSEVKLLSDKASTSLSSDYPEACAMYKMIEKLQLKLRHSLSVNLMRTRETLLKILMELKYWREALTYCKLTIPVYQRIYPIVHPLLGLQHYTSGKLEWLLGDTEDAIKSFAKAVDILHITHGRNTPFMKDLLIKLEEARAEAAYKLSPYEG